MLRVALILLACLGVPLAAAAERVDVLASHGGAARLLALSGVRYTLKEINYQSGAVVLSEQWLDFKRGRLYRRDEDARGGRWLGTDGQHGWTQDSAGTRQLTAAEAAAALLPLHYNPLFLLPRSQTSGQQAMQLSAPFIKTARITLDGHGRIHELYFDARRRGRVMDYRPIDGIPWPIRFEIWDGERRRRTGEFLRVEFNPDLSEINFAGPPPARLD